MKDCANARRCRVLPRVRPPAANACRKHTTEIHIRVAVLHEVRPYIGGGCATKTPDTYTAGGLTRGKTLHRRGHPICGGDKKKITDYADWTEKTIREIRKIRNQ